MKEIQALLEKYDYFKMDRFHSIEQPSDDTILVTLLVQNDEGEDTHHVKITFKNVKESRLLVNHALAFLDMMSGVSIIKERDLYGFAIGRCSAMLNVISAPLYVVADTVDFKEEAL